MKKKLEITPQEAFDIALNGVLKQGRRSYDSVAEDCLYDDGLGARCAVGHIVAAKIPGVKLEEGVSEWAALSRLGIRCDLSGIDGVFSDLQAIHDSENYLFDSDEEYIEHFRAEMRKFAENHDLEYKEA
jgi:hypothetical protein